MSSFSLFTAKHGSGKDCRKPTGTSIRNYESRLPTGIIDLWKESGWCGYSGGLFWLTDPEELTDILELWLGTENQMIAFGRTAFADLFLWDGTEVQYLDVHYGQRAPLAGELVFFEKSLISNNFLNKVAGRGLYRKAQSRLGKLAYDECYAFEPALALGGPGTPESLAKVKLREHLAFLAQIVLN